MKMRIGRWSAAASVAAAVVLGAGCVSVDDVKALRADLESLRGETSAARETAAGAMKDAETAMKDAETARTEAGEASRTANRALSAARDAQACCTANSEKIERMFKKSMMK